MNKAFSNFLWENEPSENTALSAENLNKVNNALDLVDSRVVTHETTKANQTDLLTAVADVTFDESTGVFTVTKKNGSSVAIDTKLERLILNWRFDAETQTLYLALDDGTEMPIDLSSLIAANEFVNSDRITLTVSADGKVTADIVKGSITGEYLEPNYLANVTAQADSASQSAETAITEANRATTEANRAEEAADRAEAIVGFSVDSELSTTSTNPVQNKVITKAMTELKISAYPINSDDELLAYIEGYSVDMAEQTEYSFAINMRYSNPAYLGGGIWKIEGFKTNTNYEYQIFKEYLSNSIKIYTRSKVGGTWGDFDNLVTNTNLSENLTNYLHITGGNIGNSSQTATYGIGLTNTSRKILAQVLDTGAFRLYDATNGKNIIVSALDGTNTFNGKASECLPLDGSVAMTGEIKLPYGNSHIGAYPNNFYLTVYNESDVNIHRQLILGNITSMVLDDCLSLRETKNGAYNSYPIFHTGNKPTGTYIGTGASKTVNTGGIGNVCAIYSGAGTAIVFNVGAITFASSGCLWDSSTTFANGVLTLGTSARVNDNGRTHNYEVL